MTHSDQKMRRIFIVSPTESGMTKRGNRHPAFATTLQLAGYEVIYLTTNFYHAEILRLIVPTRRGVQILPICQ